MTADVTPTEASPSLSSDTSGGDFSPPAPRTGQWSEPTAVTAAAQREAERLNSDWGAHRRLAEYVELTATPDDVIAAWANESAALCTVCLLGIAPGEPVVILHREGRSHPSLTHTECDGSYSIGARRYCSASCRRQAANNRRRRSHYLQCKRCGATFTGRVDARYCSTRCRVAAHRAKAVG